MNTFDRRLQSAEDRIDPRAWLPPKQGIAPEIRLLGKWWNVGWLCLFAWVFLVIFLVGGTWFIETETWESVCGALPRDGQGAGYRVEGFPGRPCAGSTTSTSSS